MIDKELEQWKKEGFGEGQIEEINLGLKQGLNVKIYAKKEFNVKQMFQIRLGLRQGLNVTVYAKPEFDYLQMEQIRWYLLSRKEAGLDES